MEGTKVTPGILTMDIIFGMTILGHLKRKGRLWFRDEVLDTCNDMDWKTNEL